MANGRITLFDQPLLQRIRAEVLLHDENRPTRRRQPVEPVAEHLVQNGFADLDRGIAPDEIEAKVGIDSFRVEHVEIRHAEPTRIAFGEFAGTIVDVDGDDPSARTTAGESQSDRAGSAPEIEEDAIVGWFRCIGQEKLGADVETAV